MPAVKPRLSPRVMEETRARIQTVQLIERVQAFALQRAMPSDGIVPDLSATQLRAIEILLRKTLPDLQAVEITGNDGGALIVNIKRFTRDTDDEAQRTADVRAIAPTIDGEGWSDVDPSRQ
jgi:hypothetical protein